MVHSSVELCLYPTVRMRVIFLSVFIFYFKIWSIAEADAWMNLAWKMTLYDNLGLFLFGYIMLTYA